MTALFLRVPWEANMPFQLGETPGPSYQTQAHHMQSQTWAAGTWSLQLDKAPRAQLTCTQPAWEASGLLNVYT